jgi:RNA polymerase sigma-70 factor (ECF subfamily)
MVDAEFAEALAAAQSGAEWAMARLWRELHPRLLRFLRGLEAEAAEDVEAETWLSAARDLARFRGGEAEFRAWLFTIARNRLIDWRRQTARRRSVPVSPQDLSDRPSGEDPADVVLDALSAETAVAAVRAALPADQAEVILLRVVAGLDVGQVAAIVGKRPGTVRVLQHRGLRRLAERLAEPSPALWGVTP